MQHHVTKVYWSELTLDELYDEERELVEKAVLAFKRAYAPYSGYHVGAAVLCKDGSVYTGQNIENYCYSPTSHAEEVACNNANADGKGDQVIKLACIGEKECSRLVAPCGYCLVRMAHYEYRAKQEMIVLFSGYGRGTVARIEGVRDLMPLSFIPEDLHGETKE